MTTEQRQFIMKMLMAAAADYSNAAQRADEVDMGLSAGFITGTAFGLHTLGHDGLDILAELEANAREEGWQYVDGLIEQARMGTILFAAYGNQSSDMPAFDA